MCGLKRPLSKTCVVLQGCKGFHSMARVDTQYRSNLPPFNPADMNQEWAELVRNRERGKAIMEYFTNLGSTQSRMNTFQPHHPRHRPLAPTQLTISALVAAGAHLGHAKSNLRPAFIPYAYGHRAGITIIDLDHTVPLLRRAANVVRAIARHNGTILFVGTRPELREVVKNAADRIGLNGYHVGEKWLPGTLTNRVALFGPEVTSVHNSVPDVVIFLNPLQNLHAIRECAIAHVPTVGIIDSDADPRIVMYPIPANDESVRTAELIAGLLSLAAKQGVELMERSGNVQNTGGRISSPRQ